MVRKDKLVVVAKNTIKKSSKQNKEEVNYSKGFYSNYSKLFQIILLLFLISLSLSFSSCTSQQIFEQGSLSDITNSLKLSNFNSFSSDLDSNMTKYNILMSEDNLPIKVVSSEEELKSIFSSSSYYGGYRGNLLKGELMMVDAAPQVPSKEMSYTSQSNSADEVVYSETNNQVEGVDEADIIKTDGNYIYTISGKNLYIIKAYPGKDSKITSSLMFNDTPQNIFINGNKLVVFGIEDTKIFDDVLTYRTRNRMTFFKIFDITDKTKPSLIKSLHIEGSYVDARLLNNEVYFIVKNTPSFIEPYPRPIYVEGSVLKENVKQVPLKNIHYIPFEYSSPELVTIYEIDVNKGSVIDSEAMTVEGFPIIYMSNNNLYLVSSQYISEWKLRQDILKELLRPELTIGEQDLISRINSIDDDILSVQEKNSKITNVYYHHLDFLNETASDLFNKRLDDKLKQYLEELHYLDFTIITKLSIGGDLKLVASNKFPGHILNQFSLDEYNGYLRLSTTIPRRWSSISDEQTNSQNVVFVLDDKLSVVGSLYDLAKNEQIYSNRFIKDRLYMVTYRQVDPFFVIDLSRPKKPEVLGLLKIPGFSKYLHPYDDNHIIGLGQDTSSTGRRTGLKISLFDVTDVNNPIESAHFVTSENYASSTAFYEHKAFLFSKEKSLLVIPAFNKNYHWDDDDYEQTYNGAFVFNINKTSINLRGIIDHSFANGANKWGPVVERSLFINDELYTKSLTLLRINSLDDLHSINNINLSKNKEVIPVY